MERCKLIECDDKIELIAEKTKADGSGKKIALTENWRDNARIAINKQTGELIITGYWNRETGDNISAEKYFLMTDEERKGWTACYEWDIITNIPHTHTRLRNNNIFVRISKLSSSGEQRLFASRYNELVEALHNMRPAIFKYENRGGTERAFKQSSRNMINRWFRLYEYEYNILITDKDLGRKIFEELKESAKKEYNETLYLKGARKKNGQTTIKIYDMGYHSKDLKGVYKLELTFRRNTFDKNEIDISDMTKQEQCIELLRESAIIEILKLKGGQGVKRMKELMMSENNILARIVRLENKTERHDERIDRHDERIDRLEAQVRKLIEKEQQRDDFS
jgi:hypothetical protein